MESKQLASSNLLFFVLSFRGLGFVLFVFKEKRCGPIQTGLTLRAATCAQVGQIKEELVRTCHSALWEILIIHLESEGQSKTVQDNLGSTLLICFCCCCSPCPESHSVWCLEVSWHKGFLIAQQDAVQEDGQYLKYNFCMGCCGSGHWDQGQICWFIMVTASTVFPCAFSWVYLLLNMSLLLSEYFSWSQVVGLLPIWCPQIIVFPCLTIKVRRDIFLPTFFLCQKKDN